MPTREGVAASMSLLLGTNGVDGVCIMACVLLFPVSTIFTHLHTSHHQFQALLSLSTGRYVRPTSPSGNRQRVRYLSPARAGWRALDTAPRRKDGLADGRPHRSHRALCIMQAPIISHK